MSKRDIDEFINKFQDQFPRPGIHELKMHWYDLDEDWPKPWPNGDKPGVYVFLASDETLLYIGKASSDRNLRTRLRAYFKRAKNGECLRKGKGLDVRYVGLLVLPQNHGFEAAAIEEYMVSQLLPPRNEVIAGKKRRKQMTDEFTEWLEHEDRAPDFVREVMEKYRHKRGG